MTTVVCTRNAAFPFALMWPSFKRAQNDFNKFKTSIESLKVCTRMNVVDAQLPQPINEFYKSENAAKIYKITK